LKIKDRLLETIGILTGGIIAGKPIPRESLKTRKKLTTSQLLDRAKQRELENRKKTEVSQVKPIESLFTGLETNDEDDEGMIFIVVNICYLNENLNELTRR